MKLPKSLRRYPDTHELTVPQIAVELSIPYDTVFAWVTRHKTRLAAQERFARGGKFYVVTLGDLRAYTPAPRGQVAYVKLGKWARRHTHCQSCGTTKKKHVGRGFCTTCFGKNKHEPPLTTRAPRKRARQPRQADKEKAA